MSVTKVVILNWNGADVLPEFLPSVVAGTPPEVEIVVADNGSTDGSAEFVERRFPSVRLVRLDRNYGFAGGYNRAIAMLEAADYYILLNSDVRTPAGWCEPLVEMLSVHDDIAAVAPKLLSEREPSRFEYAGASGGFIDLWGYPFCRGRILGTTEADGGQYDDAREVFWATGACFACRADAFRTLGGFDESFFAHQEEIDLCLRMWLAGWRVVVEPRSVVYHLGAGTLPPSPQKLYLNYRNNLAMLYKGLPRGRMQAVIAARYVLDGVSALVYLLRGEGGNFKAVWRAHRDFRAMVVGSAPDASATTPGAGADAAMRPEAADPLAKKEPVLHGGQPGLREKRRLIHSSHRATPRGIYRGSIVLRYLFGRRRFGNLM